jgi:hypothetical protein
MSKKTTISRPSGMWAPARPTIPLRSSTGDHYNLLVALISAIHSSLGLLTRCTKLCLNFKCYSAAVFFSDVTKLLATGQRLPFKS